MTRFIPAATLLLAFVAGTAQAGYTGPQSMPRVFTSVSQVREYPVEDHQVTLTGYITRRIGHDKYLFRDETGALRVEIDDDAFPAEDIDDKTRVRISGEIDTQLLDNPAVDVVRIEIVRSDQPGNR